MIAVGSEMSDSAGASATATRLFRAGELPALVAIFGMVAAACCAGVAFVAKGYQNPYERPQGEDPLAMFVFAAMRAEGLPPAAACEMSEGEWARFCAAGAASQAAAAKAYQGKVDGVVRAGVYGAGGGLLLSSAIGFAAALAQRRRGDFGSARPDTDGFLDPGL